MELKRNWYHIIWVMFPCLLMMFSSSLSVGDADSFGGFLHNYVNNSVSKPRTGVVYNISLPANFSGIRVSYIRLRSGSFWLRGVNLSRISIPPKIIPIPYVKRIAIVSENLGNWSSSFYQVPGYSLVAPVIGFTVYDSPSNSSAVGNRKLHLHMMGGPILVKFPQVVMEEKSGVMPQCVTFGSGGSFVLKNMTGPSLCSATDRGYFSLVIPTPPKKKKKSLIWQWWVVGFGGGLLVLALIGLVFMAVLRLMRIKNIRKMERESETGVTFDTVWIGKSRMPSATMVRTQPALENSYVP